MQRTACVTSRPLWNAGRRGARLRGLVPAAVILGTIAATPSPAVQIESYQVVVPVVVHTDGYAGTKWRSDVWIMNPFSPSVEVTLAYYPSAGGEQSATVEVGPYGGAFLPDIVLETFGLEDSKGMLIVATESTRLEVRARVYNSGHPMGEFGQAVPGLPLDRLARQGLLSGVSTAAGNRLSLGVANPTETRFTVHVTVLDGITGEVLYGRTVEVGAHQLVQLDKLAERWELPQRDALTLDVDSTYPTETFYAYASVVRDDTGDATFIFGTSPNTGPR